jgi:hypothetical protein
MINKYTTTEYSGGIGFLYRPNPEWTLDGVVESEVVSIPLP